MGGGGGGILKEGMPFFWNTDIFITYRFEDSSDRMFPFHTRMCVQN